MSILKCGPISKQYAALVIGSYKFLFFRDVLVAYTDGNEAFCRNITMRSLSIAKFCKNYISDTYKEVPDEEVEARGLQALKEALQV